MPLAQQARRSSIGLFCSLAGCCRTLLSVLQAVEGAAKDTVCQLLSSNAKKHIQGIQPFQTLQLLTLQRPRPAHLRTPLPLSLGKLRLLQLALNRRQASAILLALLPRLCKLLLTLLQSRRCFGRLACLCRSACLRLLCSRVSHGLLLCQLLLQVSHTALERAHSLLHAAWGEWAQALLNALATRRAAQLIRQKLPDPGWHGRQTLRHSVQLTACITTHLVLAGRLLPRLQLL